MKEPRIDRAVCIACDQPLTIRAIRLGTDDHFKEVYTHVIEPCERCKAVDLADQGAKIWGDVEKWCEGMDESPFAFRQHVKKFHTLARNCREIAEWQGLKLRGVGVVPDANEIPLPEGTPFEQTYTPDAVHEDNPLTPDPGSSRALGSGGDRGSIGFDGKFYTRKVPASPVVASDLFSTDLVGASFEIEPVQYPMLSCVMGMGEHQLKITVHASDGRAFEATLPVSEVKRREGGDS